MIKTALRKPPYIGQFCRAVEKAIRGGFTARWFNSNCGLCVNYMDFLHLDKGLTDDEIASAGADLRELFLFDGHSDDTLPFNDGDSFAYARERQFGAIYSNPLRLKFISKWAKED